MSPRPSKELTRLRAENSKLKAENGRLKKEVKQVKAKKAQKKPTAILRNVAVIFLVALAVALLTAGNLLFWTGSTIVKQDRWVASTQPIIKDPVVQQTMALYTTNKIFENIDVQQTVQNVLPPRADFLAPQLATQLKTGTRIALEKVLAKQSFHDKWNEVQARQHERIISFASKYQGDADISLNEVFNQLTSSLSDTKLSFLAGKQLPPKVGDITVLHAAWLPTFHKVVTKIDTWRLLAVILLVICLCLAMFLSRKRRRTLNIFAFTSALMMLATLVTLHVIKSTVVSQADSQYAGGVARVIQIVFHPLVIQTVTILLAALFVWVISWVSGSSSSALAVKKQTGLLFSGKAHDRLFASDNKYSLWVQNNKKLLQWGIVVAVTIIMLLVRLTLLGLFIYLFIMLLLVLAVEVIAGQKLKK